MSRRVTKDVLQIETVVCVARTDFRHVLLFLRWWLYVHLCCQILPVGAGGGLAGGLNRGAGGRAQPELVVHASAHAPSAGEDRHFAVLAIARRGHGVGDVPWHASAPGLRGGGDRARTRLAAAVAYSGERDRRRRTRVPAIILVVLLDEAHRYAQTIVAFPRYSAGRVVPDVSATECVLRCCVGDVLSGEVAIVEFDIGVELFAIVGGVELCFRIGFDTWRRR